MSSLRALSPRRPILSLALVTVAVSACDFVDPDDPTGVTVPPAVETPAELGTPWYKADSRIVFDVSAGTYEFSNYIGGTFQLTEGGTFTLRGSPGEIHGDPVIDLMGRMGFADNGAPFSIKVVSLSATTLVYTDRLGATVNASAFRVPLENAPLEDRFDDGTLDPRWWSVGNVSESAGVLNITDSMSMAGLWQLGFASVEADVAVLSATGDANCAIGYRPWDEDIIAKCGISMDSAGEVAVFAQIYVESSGKTIFHSILGDTNLGTTHRCRMVWAGGKVDFYNNGKLTDTFIPAVKGNYYYCGEPCVLTWSPGGTVHGTLDNFRAEN